MFELIYDLLQRLLNVGESIVSFMDYNILGFPMIYWLFGGGLIGYITYRIVIAITPL